MSEREVFQFLAYRWDVTAAQQIAAESTHAVCCRCHISYDVELVQEEQDGYTDDEPPHVAIFTTRNLDVAVARHRTSPWEPKRPRSSRGPAGVNLRRDDRN
jgi:hypothetical protein